MNTVSYTSFRQNLSSLMDSVHENHTPLLITRQTGTPAILISLEDFKAFEETAYIMASPRNAHRLNDSIEEFRQGGGVQRALIEE